MSYGVFDSIPLSATYRENPRSQEDDPTCRCGSPLELNRLAGAWWWVCEDCGEGVAEEDGP